MDLVVSLTITVDTYLSSVDSLVIYVKDDDIYIYHGILSVHHEESLNTSGVYQKWGN